MANEFLADIEEFRRHYLFGRRTMVVGYLDNYYQIPRGMTEQIETKMRAAGMDVTVNMVRTDASTYRNAYLFLTLDPPAAKKIELKLKGRMGGYGIDVLVKLGIRRWKDLPSERKKRHAELKTKAVAVIAAAPAGVSAPPSPPSAPRKTLETWAELYADLTLRVGNLARCVALIPTIEARMKTGHGAQAMSEIERLRAEVRDLELALDQSTGEVTRLQRDVERLTAELARTDSSNLLLIATRHPQYPNLYAIAQTIATDLRQSGKAHEELLARLPGGFSWSQSDKGTMIYAKDFLTSCAALGETEQAQVIEGLGILSREGNANKLKSRRMKSDERIGSSVGRSMVSGLGKERFVWKRHRNSITVFCVANA